MTANTNLENVSTNELRVGDVVVEDGMRLIIDRPIEPTTTTNGFMLHVAARIDNWNELLAEAAAKVADGIVNSSAQFITQHARLENGYHRWPIKGSERATWWREIDPKPAHAGQCAPCGRAYDSLLQPSCECAGDPPVGYHSNPLDPAYREYLSRVATLRCKPDIQV